MAYNLGSSSPSAEDLSHELNVFIGETRGKVDAALAELSTLANREYGYSHDATVAKDLEAVYTDIIEDNPDLAELSAVGFTALLKDGDTIETQGNICYINGTQEETDYTFSGENSDGGFEVCTAWYFENNGTLTVNAVNATVIDVVLKNKAASPNVAPAFYNYANAIKTNFNLTTAPNYVRKQRNTVGGNFADKVSQSAEIYENYCTHFPANAELYLRGSLKKVIFPYLETISGGTSGVTTFLDRCSALEFIDIPVLRRIEDTTKSSSAPFGYVPNIELPDTVEYVGSFSFTDNKQIKLICPDAQFALNWCNSTPTELFSMADDWGASINIAVAAANWAYDDYADLFRYKLRAFPSGISNNHTLKISGAAYNMMVDVEAEIPDYPQYDNWETFLLAEKNWSLTT